MLGPFFGIRQQFFGEIAIFLRCLAAWTRSCERSNCGFSVLNPYHDFRRTADQIDFWSSQQKHKRAWVHHPQRTVNIQRLSFAGILKSLTDHDLKNIAGLDELLALSDRFMKLRLSEVRANLRSGFHSQVDISQLNIASTH